MHIIVKYHMCIFQYNIITIIFLYVIVIGVIYYGPLFPCNCIHDRGQSGELEILPTNIFELDANNVASGI